MIMLIVLCYFVKFFMHGNGIIGSSLENNRQNLRIWRIVTYQVEKKITFI